ncbi:MAG: SNF2 helicase associated domain-containing protein [Lachnospiraceae bacterium]|nr:SNF2 helicase associated domain-containing protein [Lachnospiraceae bacterium]
MSRYNGYYSPKDESKKWKRDLLSEVKEETRRRAILAKQQGTQRIHAAEELGRHKPHAAAETGYVYFDFEKALADMETTPYFVERWKEYEENTRSAKTTIEKLEITTDPESGNKSLSFQIVYSEKLQAGRVVGRLDGDSFSELRTTFYAGMRNPYAYYYSEDKAVYYGEILLREPFKRGEVLADSGGNYYSDHMEVRNLPLNHYELMALLETMQYVDSSDLTDETDATARVFLTNMEDEEFLHKKEEKEAEKEVRPKVLELRPCISLDDVGDVRLSYRLGATGTKPLIVRNIADLVDAVRGRKILELTKKTSVDFAAVDFTEESRDIYSLIEKRVGTFQDVNNKYMDRYGTVPEMKVNYQEELKGELLDSFYDQMEGRSCEFNDKVERKKSDLAVGHRDMHISLRTQRLSDIRGTFTGIRVSGEIPRILEGTSHLYAITGTSLSRISPEEQKVLRPFRGVSYADGGFAFMVGKERLPEFYYRVLPGLTESRWVDVEDTCEEEAARELPPEPKFTFLLDENEQEGILSCQIKVAYGDAKYTLMRKQTASRPDAYRDTAQEMRVREEVMDIFPNYEGAHRLFVRNIDETDLFDFLRDGVGRLERYGEVRGTDAFKKHQIRSMPHISINIKSDVDLLDLSITSADISAAELAEIIKNYRLKKKYYRLRSGDFIDLTEESDLEEMQQFLDDLDLTPKDVLAGKTQIPLYRALYLNAMLERHDELAGRRDHTYKALIRNFRSIADSDFDVPESLTGVMRPYQQYGFQWLKTLHQAGFGGILADEMGLGKTLQMISVILSEEEMKASINLVVCPASLVYNWAEEFSRFAPSLNAVPVAGNLPARKKILSNLEGVQVLITSYDLLKRDIALYRDLLFNICVIDEAQYIKNPGAAQTKAVKAVKASHRFALTGTPIENRLSELWSIFDVLMPGLLFSLEEFRQKFETPIAKHKDAEATEKLRGMTGPFILRRKKADVLKDLPAKLEEVRYARIEGEQQKLYDAEVVRIRGMIEDSEAQGTTGRDKIRILAELMRIRQVCCDPSLIFEDYDGESSKRTACMDLIKSAIDGGHRMLVFSQFTSMLAILEEDLAREGISCYKITGETSKEKRVALVREFNEGDVPVFLISLKAGGTGLNLTGADVVIHYDPWWNLAAQNQATDRAHRIGQTRQVTVYRIILKHTIEEKILEMQESKKDLADAILEGTNESIMSLSDEELLQLLEP